MIVRTVVTTLCSGYNGTGYSALISVEYSSSSGEVVVLNRCLVNIGDGTVRFCKENKIKLSGISCIVVTSLAPHSISGFAGVFLSLSDAGSGKLTVVGPPGLKSYVELMTPFINRKYPELNLIEIDTCSTSDLDLTLDYMKLRFLPIYSTLAADRVIGIAATVSAASHNSVLVDSGAKKCIILPLSYYFDVHRSYLDLILWGTEGSDVASSGQMQSISDSSRHIVLFFPLAAGSYDRNESASARDAVSVSLQELCTSAKVCGILISGNLSSDMCEFRYCQNTLALLNTVCKPLFPGVQLGLQSDLDSRSISEGSTNGSVAVVEPAFLHSGVDYEPLPLFAGASLLRAVPLLTFSTAVGTIQNRGFSVLNPSGASGEVEVRQPLSRNKQLVDRCTSLKTLYTAKIQPNLEAIIAGTYTGPVVAGVKDTSSGRMDVEVHTARSEGGESATSNYSAASQLRQMMRSNKRKLSSKNLSELDPQIRPPHPPPSEAFGSFAAPPPPPPPSHRPPQVPLLPLEDFNNTGGSISKALSLSVDVDTLQQLDLNSVHPSPFNYSNSTMNSARSVFDYSETDGGDDYSYRSGSSTALTSPNDSVVTSLTYSISSSNHFNSPIRSIQQEGRKKLQRHYFDEEAFNESLLQLPLPPVHHFMSGNNIPPPNPMHDVFRLSFLGTGCAVPSKHRNNSSILLSLKGTPKISVLLDVGECTAAQIYQSVCGDVARYDAILLSIRVIWISHHHADHIVGLPQLIEQIRRAHLRAADAAALKTANGTNSSSSAIEDVLSPRQTEEFFLTGRVVRTKYDTVTQYQKVSQYSDSSKIMLIASEAIMKYFEFSLCVAGLDDLVTFYPIASTLYAGCTSDVSLATNGSITRLRSIPVHHCHSSYGVVLDFATRHKVVYSGDCRPSQSLVKAGMECDLLIHEATFDDTLSSDAVKKKHSTTSEARSIAVQMKAKHTILTHFSQRYPIVPSAAPIAGGSDLSLAASSGSSSVGVVLTPTVPSFNGISLPAMNSAVSFDFLNFSFPSQMRSLPKACEDVVKILSVVEAEKEALRVTDGK